MIECFIIIISILYSLIIYKVGYKQGQDDLLNIILKQAKNKKLEEENDG